MDTKQEDMLTTKDTHDFHQRHQSNKTRAPPPAIITWPLPDSAWSFSTPSTVLPEMFSSVLHRSPSVFVKCPVEVHSISLHQCLASFNSRNSFNRVFNKQKILYPSGHNGMESRRVFYQLELQNKSMHNSKTLKVKSIWS